MAASFVQGVGFSEIAGGVNVASPAFQPTVGNTLVVFVSQYRSGDTAIPVSGVTDTAGNTYTALGTSTAGGNANNLVEGFVAYVAYSNASNVVTAVYGAGDNNTQYRTIAVAEFSGLATSNVFDAEATNVLTASGTTATSNSVTTTNAADLLVGFGYSFSDAAELSSSGSDTLWWENNAGGTDDFGFFGREVSSTGTYTVQVGLGSSQQWVVALKALKVAASDSTAPVLTSATATATSTTTATVGATTDEGNGTLYAVVTTSNTQPSIAQIKAGQTHTGSTAPWGSSVAVSSTGAKTLSATGLTASTTYYAHLVHTDAAANDSNRITSSSFTTNTKKLKVLTHSSAASATGVAGVVFQAPTGGNITGTEIGEFTGAAFEASLESGQAVLKVPVSDFGGSSLTTSDTPVVLVRNTTNTTGIISATVVEE